MGRSLMKISLPTAYLDEGRLRQAVTKAGRTGDSLVFGRLREAD